MDINAAQTRHSQNRFWQDQPVGDHHHHIGLQVGNELLVFLRAQGDGLENRQTFFFRQRFYRTWHQLFAAPRRAVRLGEYANDLMSGRQQRVKMTRCKVRRTGENNTKRV